MNKHLEVLPKSLFAGLIAIFLYLVFSVFLGFFGITAVLLGLDIQVDANTLALSITILFTVILAVHIYEIERLDKSEDEKIKQMDLLIILSEELGFLAGNLQAYLKSLSKPFHHPLYELWRIDTSIYFTNLNHKINGKDVLELKKNLMKIKDKIILINNFKLELKVLEKNRLNEKIIKKIEPHKIIRKNMIEIIEKEVLPIVEDSKKIINNLRIL